jgi:hypothetical protein
LKRLLSSLVLPVLLGAAHAQGSAPGPGMWVAPEFFRAAPQEVAPPPTPVPTFSGERPVYALASAIGGQLSHVVAKQSVGSHMDPYDRHTLKMPDHTLDAIVLRGLDRVIARHAPDSERVFMRLNPLLLDDVPPAQREKVAFERLTAEISRWPQRHQWERIVIVTPHYRGFERGGLGSRLHGVGIYVQDLANNTEYDVIEPDGRKGEKQRNRYIALYYYAQVFVLDARTLEVIESQPWLIDEKIHDSTSTAIHIGNSLAVETLAGRIEVFAENASNTALSRTLRGVVEVKEPKKVGPADGAAPATPATPAPPGAFTR